MKFQNLRLSLNWRHKDFWWNKKKTCIFSSFYRSGCLNESWIFSVAVSFIWCSVIIRIKKYLHRPYSPNRHINHSLECQNLSLLETECSIWHILQVLWNPSSHIVDCACICNSNLCSRYFPSRKELHPYQDGYFHRLLETPLISLNF